MPERILFLQGEGGRGGGGGRGRYKARCNLHLSTLVPEVVLDFFLREKEQALTSELPDSFSPLCSFPTSQSLCIKLYPPDIFSAPPQL